MSNTQTNPFLTKIIFETQLAENELFGIVADIDPIVPGHYMLYSKVSRPSIADCDTDTMAEFIYTVSTNLLKKPYAFFERGRASFCTSMNGVQHGHGHLVPTFTASPELLFPCGTIERYSSLREAYRHINKQGQYLLWGNLGGEFFVIKNVEELPKRTIRNTIKKFF